MNTPTNIDIDWRLVQTLVTHYVNDVNKQDCSPSIEEKHIQFITNIIYSAITYNRLNNTMKSVSLVDDYCYTASGFEFYATGGEQGTKMKFNMPSFLLVTALVLGHINGLRENKKKNKTDLNLMLRELACCN
jgi:hypothetical protein